MDSKEQQLCKAFGSECGDLSLGECMKKVARQWHPDRTGEKELNEKFSRFTSIYSANGIGGDGVNKEALCKDVLTPTRGGGFWIRAIAGVGLAIAVTVLIIAVVGWSKQRSAGLNSGLLARQKPQKLHEQKYRTRDKSSRDEGLDDRGSDVWPEFGHPHRCVRLHGMV